MRSAVFVFALQWNYMKHVSNTARRNTLAVALISALMAAAPAMAQDKATNLDKITVTGSLIPQTQVETQTPVMSITAEDIQTRGFSSVAEVLQQSSLTTGGLQGGQTSGAFTQGAEAAGMFGLNPGYTKYLINGRPMLSYPALYNGSESFNNISGIPIDIVERIEVLPGGQSSLYGSDAIAGVVNIILKERMDGGTMSIRGGTYTEGGGSNIRFSAAKGFNAFDDRFHALVNVQIENGSPIWGYQRDITKQNNPVGYTAQLPSNDFAVIGNADNKLYMMDPTRCANVAGLYDGTTTVGKRIGRIVRLGVQRRLQDPEERQEQRPVLLVDDLRRERQLPAVRRCAVQQGKDRVHLRLQRPVVGHQVGDGRLLRPGPGQGREPAARLRAGRNRPGPLQQHPELR
jgi:outer membrane receptor protein involved in Fe transport